MTTTLGISRLFSLALNRYIRLLRRPKLTKKTEGKRRHRTVRADAGEIWWVGISGIF